MENFSIVIPVYNEEDNIEALIQRTNAALEGSEMPFEIIFVNDGSSDETWQRLVKSAFADKKIKAINLCRNYGQTAAIMAGIDHASGDIIIPMDGDLQNDPLDIPRLLDKVHEGYEVVSGWRKDRKDARIRRNFFSMLGNKVISALSGVQLHDYGCSLKQCDG
jgi:glycosyltransferase involved in cell wall biosynthesis